MPESRKTTGTVFNSTNHAVDLADGRMLGPSETADGIDLDVEHNRNLVLDGSIVVQDGYTPRTSEARKASDEKSEEV